MKFGKVVLASLVGCLLCGVVTTIFTVVTLVVMLALGSTGESTQIKGNTILKIDFAENIVDSPEVEALQMFDMNTFEFKQQLTTLRAVQSILAAKEDDKIVGIYLNMEGKGNTTMANLEELHAAIEAFKQSGKFVVSYNENYSQGAYYLASAADKIYMQPEGMLQWQGLASSIMFYKGLFDKLDINVEVFRPTVCRYKSAVEPYILSQMSPANRQQMEELLGSIWGVITEQVSQSRGVSVEKLNTLASNLEVFRPEDALSEGLIDGVIYEDEMERVFRDLGVEGEKLNYISLGKYATSGTWSMSKFTSDKVGVIYAEGAIVDGDGGTDYVYSANLARKIRSAREDEDIKSVVLRVNSPGGSVLASDVIWRELELLREKKPLIVSMGGYAASGGYYISCPADIIVADKLTVTGSIGVYSMSFSIQEALKRNLGITTDVVKTNASAGFLQEARKMSPIERAAMVRSVDHVYENFTSLVAEGRNLPIEKVLEIAQGRVWSGVQAVKLGLADSNAGLMEAIILAADRAGMGSDYNIYEVIPPADGLQAVLAQLNVKAQSVVASYMPKSPYSEIFEEYGSLAQALRPLITKDGMVSYSPYFINF